MVTAPLGTDGMSSGTAAEKCGPEHSQALMFNPHEEYLEQPSYAPAHTMPGNPAAASGHNSVGKAAPDHPIDLRLLQGPWLDKSKDNIPICNIRDFQICWHESGSSDFKFIPGGKLHVDIDGTPFTATFKPGSPPHLAWSDGCLWVRDDLQGQWTKDGDELLGTIRDAHMYWDAKFEHPPSKLQPVPVLPCGIVCLHLGDEECRGMFDPGPPARLTWDDGEVWVRSAVF